MKEIQENSGEAPANSETELFGKYTLGKLLGRGAFAKVYHARTVGTGESVAIKAVSKQKVAKSGCVAHVKREIAIMRRLRHPHVVKLHEVLATKTKVYFVMEFAKGGELFTKIAKGRFGEDLGRRYFRQLIAAVRYCHSRGVFHRDLKPENLLLDENWDLKVSDFGLSAVSDPARPENPMLHTLCGTPAYVAPEILAKKGYDGAKVDVWTCGVVLFVLTAGYLPFNDANLMAMYRKIYRGEFRFPKWTSPELRRLISRMLDVNPETRISLDQILRDPWFKKDLKLEISPVEKMRDRQPSVRLQGKIKKSLNAFDIISFSSGFSLSGLFDEPDMSALEERFLSAETPERVVERVGQVAKGEGLKATWQAEGWWARVEEGEGQNGDFSAAVEVHRLTAELVVVEVKVRESTAAKIWKSKLWPQLEGLVFQPEGAGPVPGGDSIEN